MFDDLPFAQLYNSDHTYVNEVLADFYGIGSVTGDEFVKMNHRSLWHRDKSFIHAFLSACVWS